jgi:hypothetical protein
MSCDWTQDVMWSDKWYGALGYTGRFRKRVLHTIPVLLFTGLFEMPSILAHCHHGVKFIWYRTTSPVGLILWENMFLCLILKFTSYLDPQSAPWHEEVQSHESWVDFSKVCSMKMIYSWCDLSARYSPRLHAVGGSRWPDSCTYRRRPALNDAFNPSQNAIIATPNALNMHI